MDNSTNYFLLEYRNKFPLYSRANIKEIMSLVDKEERMVLQSLDYKDPNMIFILSLTFGYLGVDRFLIGDNLLGVLKLLTFGGCGLWFIIDLFLIINRTRTQNYNMLLSVANSFKKLSF